MAKCLVAIEGNEDTFKGDSSVVCFTSLMKGDYSERKRFADIQIPS